MSYHEYQLKIESGVGGGSISLWKNLRETDGWTGDWRTKKNDHLIEEIAAVLERNNLSKRELKKITYSNYPGSQTGLKIVSSTIRGLSSALGIETESKNLFESIADHFKGKIDKQILIILPVSPKEFEFAAFGEDHEKVLEGNSAAFFELLNRQTDLKNTVIIAPAEISENLSIINLDLIRVRFAGVVDTGKNLSAYL